MPHPKQTQSNLPTPADLLTALDGWRSRRIVVAGDFMLDRYSYGNADRLCPDAPVPVLAIARTEDKPGGAANVCLDLRDLDCDVTCLGVRGSDHAGEDLAAALDHSGCQTQGLIAVDHRPTTVKQSLVGLAQHRHPQKMFRLDIEDKSPIDAATEDALLAQADAALPGAAALCLEDYNKGVLTPRVCRELIAKARALDIPVLVDPAAIDDYSKYFGSTCITPNRFEAWIATGQSVDHNDVDQLPVMAAQLQRDHDIDVVMLTADRHGVLLRYADRATLVPTAAKSVYDVTGAGDMVLAMLAAARANGLSWIESTALANVAAGIEIEKTGIVPVPLDEIRLRLLRDSHEQLGKLRTLDHLLPELQAHRGEGKRIVFTNGCFDILHAGHVSYLRAARQRGDMLIIGLNSDDSIRRLKGAARPVNHQADRVTVISELESVDYIVVFDEDTPLKLIEAIKPDVLAKGADYAKHEVVGHEIVEAAGGEIALIPLVEGRSTTNLIRKMQAG